MSLPYYWFLRKEFCFRYDENEELKMYVEIHSPFEMYGWKNRGVICDPQAAEQFVKALVTVYGSRLAVCHVLSL